MLIKVKSCHGIRKDRFRFIDQFKHVFPWYLALIWVKISSFAQDSRAVSAACSEVL